MFRLGRQEALAASRWNSGAHFTFCAVCDGAAVIGTLA
jgi:hypothetical protein